MTHPMCRKGGYHKQQYQKLTSAKTIFNFWELGLKSHPEHQAKKQLIARTSAGGKQSTFFSTHGCPTDIDTAELLERQD